MLKHAEFRIGDEVAGKWQVFLVDQYGGKVRPISSVLSFDGCVAFCRGYLASGFESLPDDCLPVPFCVEEPASEEAEEDYQSLQDSAKAWVRVWSYCVVSGMSMQDVDSGIDAVIRFIGQLLDKAKKLDKCGVVSVVNQKLDEAAEDEKCDDVFFFDRFRANRTKS